MAGIGFELKKMFTKKGLLATIPTYGYAGIVCVGPMILGIALLLGIRVIADLAGASSYEEEVLNSVVTYTLLCSLVLTNCFSLVTTRYTADQLFMEKKSKVLPSFLGSSFVMIVIGCIFYGIFLCFSGLSFFKGSLVLLLFVELILVWNEMNYLTAIKDYKGILYTFAVALLIAWGVAWILLLLGIEIITALLISICAAYCVMAVWYYKLLVDYFPESLESPMDFLRWFDRYPQLSWLGLFLSLGLFGHIVIMWTGQIPKHIMGLFYGAPQYDIPALLAFLSILVTTINFVTSVEVNFYPKYRNYISLFNDGGSLMDIRQSEKEMKAILQQELAYTFTRQFFATIVFIILGSLLLPYLPLGIDADMIGIYRVLCVAYAFYAIGNCTMLIQLYFADNKGALIGGSVFMIISCVATAATSQMEIRFYGIGFLFGSMFFFFTALFLLWRYLQKIMYHILCNQPIVKEERRGWKTVCSEKFAVLYERRLHKGFDDIELEDESVEEE